jgi:hypothetical protein
MRGALLALLVPVAACGPGLTAYNADPIPDDDTDPESAAIRIERLEPSFGPIEGGNQVTIHGAGFEGDVAVKFGRADVAHERLGPGRLVVTAPFAGERASVDVTVTSELGVAVLPGGYTYGDGPPPDTGDTGDTGTPGPTGLIGGLAELSRLQVACPGCFGVTQDLFIDALAVFHAPTSRGWLDWLPPQGSCVGDPPRSAPTSGWRVNGDWAYLQSGSANAAMRRTNVDGGPIYQGTGLSPAAYLNNGAYDLSVPTAGAIGPAFEIRGMLRAPQGFSSIAPAGLLETSTLWAFSQPISRRGASFSWSPSGGSGSFVIIVDAYDDWTGAYLGQVVCHGADNGGMTVPGSALSRFPVYSLLAVGLYRTAIGDGVNPVDGSTVQSFAQSGVLGTGYLEL